MWVTKNSSKANEAVHSRFVGLTRLAFAMSGFFVQRIANRWRDGGEVVESTALSMLAVLQML